METLMFVARTTRPLARSPPARGHTGVTKSYGFIADGRAGVSEWIVGNWSKVPALQIAASLEKMAWQERMLSIDSALRKFERALVGLTFQHSLCVLEDLRGLLGSYDLPVLFFLSLLPLPSHFSCLLTYYSDFPPAWKLFTVMISIVLLTVWPDIMSELYVWCNTCSVNVISNRTMFFLSLLTFLVVFYFIEVFVLFTNSSAGQEGRFIPQISNVSGKNWLLSHFIFSITDVSSETFLFKLVLVFTHMWLPGSLLFSVCTFSICLPVFFFQVICIWNYYVNSVRKYCNVSAIEKYKRVTDWQAAAVVKISDTFPGTRSVKIGTSISAANTTLSLSHTHTHTHTHTRSLPAAHTLQLAVHQGPCQIAELFQGLAGEWEAQVTIHASPRTPGPNGVSHQLGRERKHWWILDCSI